MAGSPMARSRRLQKEVAGLDRDLQVEPDPHLRAGVASLRVGLEVRCRRPLVEAQLADAAEGAIADEPERLVAAGLRVGIDVGEIELVARPG